MTTKLDKTIEGKGEVKGFTFHQEVENKDGYIYKVDNGVDKPYFEVFQKKETAICLDFKERIYSETDTKEVYPKAKDFGVWAWTVTDLDKAAARLSNFSTSQG